jgi:hypothetical protein
LLTAEEVALVTTVINPEPMGVMTAATTATTTMPIMMTY